MRVYMTDGQLNQYCRSQAEAMGPLIDMAVSRMLPLAKWPMCKECGALVLEVDLHKDWHRGVNRTMNELSPDFKGY